MMRVGRCPAEAPTRGRLAGMTEPTLPVCIIGAGSSGIVSLKVLRAHGIDVDCFEIGSDIGGNWRYDNDNGRSAAYASLHIDTSKDRMAFSDFPMPRHWPAYLHHTQVLAYFERYVEHFDLRPAITFRTEVVSVAPHEDGWEVTVRNLDTDAVATKVYRAVLVANGHHWDERWPDIPGTFTGDIMHSHSYRTPDVAHGRRVVVLGAGNSAADIACEVSWHADEVTISTRRGAHIIPRYLLGRPTDTFTNPLISRLPIEWQRIPYRALLWIARGRQSKYGFPEPDHPLLAEHPTLSQDLLGLVRSGDIAVKPAIVGYEGSTVRFADDSEIDADLVIYATGYRISFPFLPDEVLRVEDNHIPLYRKVVHPDLPGLFFIGLIQPLGAIMPLAELQAEWVARILRGAPLPSTDTMKAAIAGEQDEIRRRYVDSPRHTIQVDFFPYKQLMRDEIAAADEALRPSPVPVEASGA